MVRKTTLKDLERDLIEELFSESKSEDRCPYIKKDKISPYCSKDLGQGEEITDTRRRVCGLVSLQMWCLDKTRSDLCIWHQYEPF